MKDKPLPAQMRERRRDIQLVIIDNAVCKRIIYCREERNLTPEKLATKVGVPLKRLIDIEAGSRVPRIEELAQLAAGLNVSIGELVNSKQGPR